MIAEIYEDKEGVDRMVINQLHSEQEQTSTEAKWLWETTQEAGIII